MPDSIKTCQKLVRTRFKDFPEERPYFFGWSNMTSEQIFDLVYRHKNGSNPNKSGMSWNSQDGDETLGTYKSVWKR